MVGESDEEVFANEDELDLNEDEASVLCRAESKSWSMNRDQKRQQRKDRQLIDRLTMAVETFGSERKLEVPTARLDAISECDKCGERRHWYRQFPKPPRARSLELSSFAHLAPEGRGCGCQQSRRARSRRQTQLCQSYRWQCSD